MTFSRRFQLILSALAVMLFLKIFGLAANWIQHPDGIIGNPALLGYSEGLEKWLVIAALLGSLLVFEFSLKAKYFVFLALPALAFINDSLGLCVAYLALAFLPFGVWVNKIQIDEKTENALLGSLGFVGCFLTNVKYPGQEINVSLLLFCTFCLSTLCVFFLLRQFSNKYLAVFALLPTLRMVCLQTHWMWIYAVLLPVFFLKHNRQRELGAASLIYFSMHRFIMAGHFSASEGDIFQAAISLLNGQSMFIPHGTGLAWIGALGYSIFGKTLSGFRLPYLLLSPLVSVLMFYFVYVLTGRRKLWTSALVACLAAQLSGFADSYPVGMITWFGGIKLIVPLLTLLAAIQGRNGFLLGILAALSTFVNMEYGVATAASVMVYLIATKRSRELEDFGLFTITGLLLASDNFYYLFLKFPLLHSAKYGLPLFTSYFHGMKFRYYDFASQNSFFEVNALLPFFSIVACLWMYWKKRKAWFLMGAVFTFVIYQIALGRSDHEHFRAALGLSGLFLLLSLSELLSGREFAVSLLLLSLLPNGGVIRKVAREWVIKEAPPVYSDKLSGSLSEVTLDFVTNLKNFMGNPKTRVLGDEALFLTEEGYAAKIFLGLKDVTGLSMHHYIMDSDQERAVIKKMEKDHVGMVFFDRSYRQMRYVAEREIFWPLLVEYTEEHFIPCRSVGAMVTLFVRPRNRFLCAPLDEKQEERNFPTSMDWGFFPSQLGKTNERGVSFELSSAKDSLSYVRWGCHDDWHLEDERRIYFERVKGLQRYTFPLFTTYCKKKPERVEVLDDGDSTNVILSAPVPIDSSLPTLPRRRLATETGPPNKS